MLNKVSIVIPVYNAEKYLVECVESVLNQTYKEIEVIAVNDGSTDSSLDILKRYSDKIRIISKPNGGTGSALNAGINEMTGEWFKLFGADDILYPNAIEELVMEAQSLKNKENLILYSNYERIDIYSNTIGQFLEPNYNEMDQFEFNTMLLDHMIGNAITSFIHRSAFDRYGRYDEKLGFNEDYELWLRFCVQYNCRVHLVSKVLAKWRRHNEQLGIKKIGRKKEKDEEIRRLVLSKMDPLLREKYRQALIHYRKKRPFILKARAAIGSMIIQLLPDSIATKYIQFYLKRKGLYGKS